MPGDKGKYNEYGNHSLIGQDSEESEKVRNAKIEPDIGALRVAGFVWDPIAMEFVRETQGLTEVDDVEDILKGNWYHDTMIDYNVVGDVVYIGAHVTMGASISGTGWLIEKYDYDVNYNVNRTRVQTGTWTDRALGWS